ncbi:hypothetical protein BJ875DRAFT_13765 [Amylocarpus encephaloides]|uniref:Uncharacterized protein n=1 Tax=Amylocarpus encephaloides TaxID=45428 RepID=A0A9P7YS52_9HELO|nr:hypothetical protein BJ875DRAFT_13765 [Amylocarpus encephaloides]
MQSVLRTRLELLQFSSHLLTPASAAERLQSSDTDYYLCLPSLLRCGHETGQEGVMRPCGSPLARGANHHHSVTSTEYFESSKYSAGRFNTEWRHASKSIATLLRRDPYLPISSFRYPAPFVKCQFRIQATTRSRSAGTDPTVAEHGYLAFATRQAWLTEATSSK